MHKKLVGLAGLIPFLLFAEEPEIIEHNLPDDGFVQIDLQFSFPYKGNLYTTTFMGSNGVLMLMDPTGTNGQWSYCCNGQPLESSYAPSFVIMPLWTDLINYNNEGKFYTQGNDEWQRYMWYNLSEYYYNNWDNKNTFGTELDYLGNISFFYENLNITGHYVTIGYTGDLSEDSSDYTQYYYDYGISTEDVEVDENYELKIYESPTQPEPVVEPEPEPVVEPTVETNTQPEAETNTTEPETVTEPEPVIEPEPVVAEPTFEETYVDNFVDSMITDSYAFEDFTTYDDMQEEAMFFEEPAIEETLMFDDPMEDILVMDEEIYDPIVEEPMYEEEMIYEEVFEEELFAEEIYEEEILDEYYEEAILEEELVEEEVSVLSADVLSAVLSVLKTDEETLQQQVSDSQDMTMSFDNMMNDAIAVGSLSQFLSMELPNYSRFEIQSVETPQMERAEETVASMPQANVESMLQNMTETMQESGGFEDQSSAVILMNGLSNLGDYYNIALTDNPNFYKERIIYRGNLPDARMSILRMNYNSSQIYDEMVGAQYGRN